METENDMLDNRIYHFKSLKELYREKIVGVKERTLSTFNSYLQTIKRDPQLHYFTSFTEEKTYDETGKNESTLTGARNLIFFPQLSENSVQFKDRKSVV